MCCHTERSYIVAGMPAEEGEALGDLGIPRRQRGSRRRLSFDRMTHEPVYERPRAIERHTSGIYDLIDAIGLLGGHCKSSQGQSQSDSSPFCHHLYHPFVLINTGADLIPHSVTGPCLCRCRPDS